MLLYPGFGYVSLELHQQHFNRHIVTRSFHHDAALVRVLAPRSLNQLFRRLRPQHVRQTVHGNLVPAPEGRLELQLRELQSWLHVRHKRLHVPIRRLVRDVGRTVRIKTSPKILAKIRRPLLQLGGDGLTAVLHVVCARAQTRKDEDCAHVLYTLNVFCPWTRNRNQSSPKGKVPAQAIHDAFAHQVQNQLRHVLTPHHFAQLARLQLLHDARVEGLLPAFLLAELLGDELPAEEAQRQAELSLVGGQGNGEQPRVAGGGVRARVQGGEESGGKVGLVCAAFADGRGECVCCML